MRKLFGTLAVGAVMAASAVGSAGVASAAPAAGDLVVRGPVAAPVDGVNTLRRCRTCW